jgi:hypothetical protein
MASRSWSDLKTKGHGHSQSWSDLVTGQKSRLSGDPCPAQNLNVAEDNCSAQLYKFWYQQKMVCFKSSVKRIKYHRILVRCFKYRQLKHYLRPKIITFETRFIVVDSFQNIVWIESQSLTRHLKTGLIKKPNKFMSRFDHLISPITWKPEESLNCQAQ